MVRAISDNNDSTARREAKFTPSAATETLPLVRRIVADLMRLNQSIAAQREQLRGVDNLDETIEHADYQEELRDIRASLSDDEQRFQQCLGELTALGIEPHFPIDGSVDFPAVVNRREVRLCWHPDDDQVSHWHEPGQTPEQRKPVDAKAFGLESLN
jgi:hypothetical protein